jgi:hypothetical protein
MLLRAAEVWDESRMAIEQIMKVFEHVVATDMRGHGDWTGMPKLVTW